MEVWSIKLISLQSRHSLSILKPSIFYNKSILPEIKIIFDKVFKKVGTRLNGHHVISGKTWKFNLWFICFCIIIIKNSVLYTLYLKKKVISCYKCDYEIINNTVDRTVQYSTVQYSTVQYSTVDRTVDRTVDHT